MFKINHIKPDKLNLQEYIDFFVARNYPSVTEEGQLDSLKARLEQTVHSQFENYITDVIVATHKNGELLGGLFLGIMENYVLIDEYDPVVKEIEQKDAIALALIDKTKEVALSHNKDYIRLFLGGITTERQKDPSFRRYYSWFIQSGFYQTHECECLEVDITEIPPIKKENLVLPSEYTINPLHDVPMDDIIPLYNKIFADTPDRFIMSLSPPEKEEFIHLFFDKSKIHSTSCALFLKDQMVGYLSVQNTFQDGLEITAFGIDPQIRGKGLGQKLLQTGITKFHQAEFKFLYTEVDPLNPPPANLYKKLGFVIQENKIGFLWKRV
ncbi:MAG: GNAT family N-acetyltransferase [Candidatus Hermodarchaeota archaeon]